MIRHLLISTAAASGLLLCGLTAGAQEYSPRTGDGYYQQRDQNLFLERVQSHLDRAESAAAAFSDDGGRIARAREDLGIFTRRMNDGDYDAGALTNSIVDIQRVLDNNRLYVETRQALLDDLSRLRDLRESHER